MGRMRVAWLGFVWLGAGCGLILGIDSPTLVSTPDAGTFPDAAAPAVIIAGNVHALPTSTERLTFGFCPTVHWREAGQFRTRHIVDPNCEEMNDVDVPDGADYYASFGDFRTWAITRARQVDLGIWIIGHPVELFGAPSTQMDMTATGLSPTFENGDSIDLFSPTTGMIMGMQNNPRLLTPYPTVGSATLNLNVDFENQPILGDTFSDELWMIVFHFGDVGGNNVGRVKMVAPMDLPQTVASGQLNSISGAFAAPTVMRNIAIDFKRSQFDAMRSQVNANAMPFTTRVRVRVQPVNMAGENPSQFSTHFVLYYDNNELTDVNLGSVAVLNPYPAAWIYVREVEFGYFVPFTIGANTYHAHGFLRTVVDVDSVGPTVTPVISPPQGPTVNARGAFADATDIGMTPTIAWQPPVTGTPTRYVVKVTHLHEGMMFGDQHFFYLPARLTSFTIPPDILDPTAWHVFTIDAVIAGGNPETEPFLLRLPWASASVVTGKFAVGSAPF